MSPPDTPYPIGMVVNAILDGYRSYRSYFRAITDRAMERFIRCDWKGMQADANERLDAYQTILLQTVSALGEALTCPPDDRGLWMAAKTAIAPEIDPLSDPDLAETFYNSVARRLGNIVGADARREFLREDPRPLPAPRRGVDYHHFPAAGRTVKNLFREILETSPFRPYLHDLAGDAHRAAQQVHACRGDTPDSHAIRHIDMVAAPFFRGMGAYLIGRIATADGGEHPLALALINTDGAVTVDGVITDTRGFRILFSYTHSYFHVGTDRIMELIAFLHPLLPHRRLAELYISLGFNRHGKTELYRDLARHQNACRDIFELSPGKPGMVMAVFNMPSDDMVFKIIRDHFAQPKRTTRRQVMAQYDFIFRHDRTGRLPDTQSFEHLCFDHGCFDPTLIRALRDTAARSVTFEGDKVTIELAYVERRVRPLDLYLAEAPPEAARQAVIDFGQAIKDLAYSNIFPGDMLLKNFGVTALGRVIFYDFDEVCPLTDCRFRRKPKPRSHEDELSSEPWYYVAENDIFPEEFGDFLGLAGDLRDVFMTHHADLLNADFWQRTQESIGRGDPIHVFPYTRLGSCPPRPRRTPGAHWTFDAKI
jgi:isocitrate dehydrogenase kinase/phosphatase